MPILDVEIVVPDLGQLKPNLPTDLSDAIGLLLGVPPGKTWVRVRELLHKNYEEGGGGAPEGTRVVFVEILRRKNPPPEELRSEVAKLTQLFARVCECPADNVHILYKPDGRGRVAFGGKLVE
jgi:phenylpyruvate tautomerase PptA (4-oxalocrotonate tautomerase family)